MFTQNYRIKFTLPRNNVLDVVGNAEAPYFDGIHSTDPSGREWVRPLRIRTPLNKTPPLTFLEISLKNKTPPNIFWKSKKVKIKPPLDSARSAENFGIFDQIN